MKKSTRYVGLDVHAQTIAIAVAEGGRDGEVRSLGTIPNTPEAVRKAVKKLGSVENLAVCYEAGPCGIVLSGSSAPSTPRSRERRRRCRR